MTRIYVDTNILLHAKPLQDIAWETHEATPVTIIITKTNIRELDRHKDQHPKKTLRERARRALQRIERSLTNAGLRPGVSLAIDDKPANIDYAVHSLDPSHADDQIIASVIQARTENRSDVVVLYTHDVGPRLTAARLGIIAKELPEEDKLPPAKDETEQENERLRHELHELRSAAPTLHLAINGETKTVAATTLNAAPAPVDEEQTRAEARAVREKLPRFANPGTEDPDGMVIVDGRRLLSLDALGIPDPNAIRTSEYQRYQNDCDRYEADYRTYLGGRYEGTEERSRTIKLAITLHNTGGKPAEDTRITITFPPTLTLRTHAPGVPRPPTAPTPPRNNGLLQREIMEQITNPPGFSIPRYNPFPDLNPQQTGPDIDEHEVSWWVRRLRHTYDRDLGVIYLTIPEPLQPFTMTYRLHATNATKPFSGQVLVKPCQP